MLESGWFADHDRESGQDGEGLGLSAAPGEPSARFRAKARTCDGTTTFTVTYSPSSGEYSPALVDWVYHLILPSRS